MGESKTASEAEHDARIAAQTEPSAPRERTAGDGIPGRRTPRWLWLWLLPLVVLLMFYLARHVLGPFIIAGVLAYIFSLLVDSLEERLRWPRALIVSLLYLLVLGALGIGLYFGASALYRESRDLVTNGPQILESTL